MNTIVTALVALLGFAAAVAWAGDQADASRPPVSFQVTFAGAGRLDSPASAEGVCRPSRSASAVVNTRPCPNTPIVLCACLRPTLSA
jgi:hypothetical protein